MGNIADYKTSKMSFILLDPIPWRNPNLVKI